MKAILIAFLLTLPALGQNSTPNPADDIWLHPSDSMIAKAIDDGFSNKKLPKDARYHLVRTWLKPGVDARFEIIPPLFCALDQGREAHDKLESKPALEDVKKLCLNTVTVKLIHYSPSLDANWPCVFEKDGTTLQALIKVPDKSPQSAKYYPGGFSTDDILGYKYYDFYSFEIPKGWGTSATMIYADERGNHHPYTIDFSSFIKDATDH